MKTPTDGQLNLAKMLLAKVLPDVVFWNREENCLCWCVATEAVRDTELLYLSALAENTLTDDEHFDFRSELRIICDKSPSGPDRAFVSAPWYQRVTALAAIRK